MDAENLGIINKTDDNEDDDNEEIEPTIIEILQCKEDDNLSDKNFLSAAKFFYKVGIGDSSNNGTNELTRRTGLSPNTIQEYKDAFFRQGLITREEKGRKKVFELTDEGKDIFEVVKPLFNRRDYISEVEEALVSFEQLYSKKPALKEIRNLMEKPVTEEDLVSTSVNWSPETYDEGEKEKVREKLSIGFVIANTSAQDVLAGDDRGPTKILFSQSDEGRYNKDYVESNFEFFDNLELEYDGNYFRLSFDEFTNFILGQESFVFSVQPEEIEEELEEIAEYAIF